MFLKIRHVANSQKLNDLRIQTSCLPEFHRWGGEVNGAFNKQKKTREMFWSGRPDLNRGPPAPKAGALPKFRSPIHGNNHALANQR